VNRKFILLYWLVGVVIAIAAIAIAFYFDESAHRYVTTHQDRTLRNFMHAVSRFGDWPEHFALGVILMGVAWLRQSKRWARIFLAMLLACALAGIIARGIKITTGRARPSVKSEEVWNGPRFSSKYHAFPSGHTAASTAFFAVLLFVNWRIGLACLPIPIVIGLSRMYVAAHYLSDIIFAAILGVLSAYLIVKLLLRGIENRKTEMEN